MPTLICFYDKCSRRGKSAKCQLLRVDPNTQQRDDLRDTDFAYVDNKGEHHLPIHDEEHVRNAAARFSQTRFESTEAKHKATKGVMAAAKKSR